MARPRFEVVDDPLALSPNEKRAANTPDAAVAPPKPGGGPAIPDPSRPRKQSRPKAPGRKSATPSSSGAEELEQEVALWEPPALDETLALIAARLPRSLDRALDEHTHQLRRSRNGASQKRLPKQEVLAMAIWALGDPDDERAQAKLEALYEQYRGRRLAVAAAAAIERSRTASTEGQDGPDAPSVT